MTAQLVDTSQFPLLNVDLETLSAKAAEYGTMGQQVRDRGADVVAAWQPIASSYSGPGDTELLTAMDLVGPTTTTLGDELESVKRALDDFVTAVTPIVADIEQLNRDAEQLHTDAATFEREGTTRRMRNQEFTVYEEWHENGPLVDENNRIIGGLTDKWIAYQAAERDCANAIRALSCMAPLHAIQGEDDALGYGYEAIPDDTELPWGTQTRKTENCGEATGRGIKEFVWDGLVVEGLGGTLAGLGALVGIRVENWNWSWNTDNLGETWSGIGQLIGRDAETGEWFDGEGAGESWTALGKSIIMWDDWEENPGKALGGSIFNIATTFIPVAGVVTKVTKIGTAGRVGSAIARAETIVDALDPVTWISRGGGLAITQIGDSARALHNLADGNLLEMMNFRGLDFEGMDANGQFDFTPANADVDAPPPVRQEPSGDSSVQQPVREPALVGAGGGGGTLGDGVPSGTGGSGSGDGGSGSGSNGGTGDGGSGSNGDQGSGSGDGTGGSGDGDSGGGTGNGESSGNGGDADPTPGDTEPTPVDTDPTPVDTDPTPGDTDPIDPETTDPELDDADPGEYDDVDVPENAPTPVGTPSEHVVYADGVRPEWMRDAFDQADYDRIADLPPEHQAQGARALQLAGADFLDEHVRRFQEGRLFNIEQWAEYPANEVYLQHYERVLDADGHPVLDADGNEVLRETRRTILDSYDPGVEIVSRKHTQLAEVQPATAIGYLRELLAKYPSNDLARVADVPSAQHNPALAAGIGRPLTGEFVLEVPRQDAPIPDAVQAFADRNLIEIREV